MEECPEKMEEQIQVDRKEEQTVSQNYSHMAHQIVIFLQLLGIAGFVVANILKMSTLFKNKAVSRKGRSAPRVDKICF